MEMRLTAEYGVTDQIGVELQLSLKLNRTTVVYERVDGTPFTPDYPNIHHRDETLFGPGDALLMGRFSGTALGFTLTGKLGVSLPLGSTEENPFALGEMGLEHQHVQFGTGTFDPMLVADVARQLGERLQVRLHGRAQLMLYENGHGYRAGNRYAVGVQGGFSLTPKVSLSLTTDVVNEQPERWGGEVLQDGNLGRTDVLVGAGATFQLGDFSLTAGVRVPVYQHIIQTGDEAAQLSYPAIVDLTVQRTFEVLGQ